MEPRRQTTNRELINLNVKIGEAEKQGDTDFLRSVLLDALKFRRANGTIVDKSTYLGDQASSEIRYKISEAISSIK